MLRGLRYLKVREKGALARRRGRGMRNARVKRGNVRDGNRRVGAGWVDFSFF